MAFARGEGELCPVVLRQFIVTYIDASVLLLRILTRDKTMDVDVSHPAKPFKGLIVLYLRAGHLCSKNKPVTLSLPII